MAEKRTYQKKDVAYWNRHHAPAPTPPVVVHTAAAERAPRTARPFPDIAYGSTQIATAAGLNGGGDLTSYRGRQLNTTLEDAGAYQNIKSLPSPWGGYDSMATSYSPQEAINLCTKAYGGIPVVRNAVEIAVEFFSQPLYVKSENGTVRTFFQEWLHAIMADHLTEQYARDFFTKGAVYFLRFDGQFGPAFYSHFQNAYGAKENRVPIRYVLINPATINAVAGIATPYTYVRILSTWEIDRLRNPLTEQDKQVFNDLPEECKVQIKSGLSNPYGIAIPLDPKRLRYSFYKKQDYDPFGTPFIWPILPSVEWKLTLAKMDKALARSTEHAILLLTMGEPANEYNGGNGINQNNIARVQALMSNQTIGRVLVGDWTMKDSKWLVPPIQEILGPEKYEIVNEDIREGLQSILTGSDKFANAQIKAKIFIRRLEQAQRQFLNEFLMPEVKQVCDIMGFRHVPEIGFQKIDLQDEAIMARIYTQLVQIGALTAEQGIKAMQTQLLPDAAELIEGQKEYKQQREDGLFEPLIGGQKDEAEEGGAAPSGRPGGSGKPQSGTRTSSPIGTSKGAVADLTDRSDRTDRTDAFSMREYTACLAEADTLSEKVAGALRKKFKVKGDFSDAQARVVRSLVQHIIATEPREGWTQAVAGAMKEPPAIPADVAAELDDISERYEVDGFDAAILRHCRRAAPGA